MADPKNQAPEAPVRPRLAVVEASPNRAKFGNKAVRAFLSAGYEVSRCIRWRARSRD